MASFNSIAVIGAGAWGTALAIALKNAGVPVEMHLYAEGGHAFGLRPAKFPITRWPELVETWLRTIRMISE